MTSKLHTEARKAYNVRGAEAVAAIELMPSRDSKPPVPPEKSDAPVVGQFNDSNVELDSYREYRLDYAGAKVACYFFVRGRGLIGVSGVAHESVRELSRRLANDKAYRDKVSEAFSYNTIVDWLRLTITTDSAPNVVEYFEAVAVAQIQKREIWVPFPVLQITQPIQIGNVVFRRVTKPMMDAYAEKLNAYEDARSGAVFDHLRSRLQATTAACVTVEAELSKAEEIAAEEADAAIGILRLACPVLLDVYQWAPVDPAFLDAMGGTRFLRVDGGQIQNDHSALPVRMRAQLVFTPEDIQLNKRQIWGFGHNLLVIKRNDFQELLLGALLHFSKSMLKSDTSERLMYVITALEALFVREGEPIVQNLRERLAVMQGPAINERLKSLETITKVYDIRSRFVHRAVAVADMSLLADFFVEAWAAMFFVLNNYNKWSTKVEFLDYIDSFKFRGPEFTTEGLPSVQVG
jgi:hypothetical protein